MDVQEIMNRFSRWVHKNRHDPFVKDVGIMPQADFVLLSMMEEYTNEHPELPGIYSSTLADRMGISRPAISRHVRILEERGWICRETDPNSRRNAFLQMTDEGKQALKVQQGCVQEMFEEVCRRLGMERVRNIINGIAELTEVMNDVRLEALRKQEEPEQQEGEET